MRGLVASLTEGSRTIAAEVLGTRPYHARLWAVKGELGFSCTCPVGDDGVFCKHCVAIGLAWLSRDQAERPAPTSDVEPATSMDDVRQWLSRQKKSALVALLAEHAAKDDSLYHRLLMKAAKRQPGGPDLVTYKQMIDAAVETGEFVDYAISYDYAADINDAIDAIEELLRDGHASAAIEVSEHALRKVEGAMGFVDDSDGNMSPILERLQEIHLEACRKAKPEPEVLARRLFAWELGTEWDTFLGAADTYARVLGKQGVETYRRLAEAEWEKVPPLVAGAKVGDKFGKRFRIAHIMETLARLTGDVEEVVAVKKRDLSMAYNYLEIAEVYRAAGKTDQALEWAERGVRAFPNRTDPRLREFLADEYHRRKRHDKAMALVWSAFEESPDLQRYKNLKIHADKAGEWQTWHSRALSVLRETTARQISEHRKQSSWFTPDHSELVRVYLWEGDVEAAWDEAVKGGCSDDLWIQLAEERERHHPEDAIPVYQQLIEPALRRKNNHAYRQAVGLLRKIHELMGRTGRGSEFAPYVDAIRAAHKRKRNFIKMLERARWR